MYKLLTEEKSYLSELKQFASQQKVQEQVEPLNEEARLNEYLDFMQEADELFLEDMNDAELLQEIDIAKLKSDVMRFIGLKRTLGDKIKAAVGQGDTSAAEKLKNQLTALEPKIAAAKKAIAQGASKAVETGKEVASDVAKGAGKAFEKGKDIAGDVAAKAKDVAGDVSKSASKYADKAGDVAKDVAKGAEKMGGKIAKGAGELAGKAKDLASTPGAQYAAAGAVAAYKAYQRFFSQAARACKGKSGAEKTGCMKQFKVKGLQASKTVMAASVSKCAKTKDPAKCKLKIQSKMQGIDAKMAKLKG